MPDIALAIISVLLFLVAMFNADVYGTKVLKLLYISLIAMAWLLIAGNFTELEHGQVEYFEIQDAKMPEGHILQVFDAIDEGETFSSRKELLSITNEDYYYPPNDFNVKKITAKSRFSGGIYWIIGPTETYEICRKNVESPKN
mgnify:CR=1 FL=1